MFCIWAMGFINKKFFSPIKLLEPMNNRGFRNMMSFANKRDFVAGTVKFNGITFCCVCVIAYNCFWV